MIQCRNILQESAKRILRIADECLAECGSVERSDADKKLLREIAETLFNTVKLENTVAEIIPAAERAYVKNEQRIADYFDLAVQRVPHTELGISKLDSLREHEAQMPFGNQVERRTE